MNKGIKNVVMILFCLTVLAMAGKGWAAATAELQRPETARIQEMYGKLPLYFIENKGQLDSAVSYYVQGADTTLYFTREGVTFGLTGEQGCGGGSCFAKNLAGPQPMGRWAVKLDFVGANSKATVKGEAGTSAKISYFKGPKETWKTGLATYGRLVYSDLWPGIDLVYEGDSGRLKGTFVVKPGADPSRIQLAYEGAQKVSLTKEGRIQVETPVGSFSEDAPVSYQEIAGKRVEVQTPYTLISPKGGATAAKGTAQQVSSADPVRVYGFAVGTYDVKKPLVIDPVTLIYSGYIGGNAGDAGIGIAVDSTGAAYVTGYTYSSEATFPVVGGPDLTFNGGDYDRDVFVAKVAPDGTALTYAGYLGGASSDFGYGIAVDGAGAAYVTGFTYSSEATFPVVGGPDLTYNGGIYDAFVAKVAPDGTTLSYAGYIGGNSYDYAYGIAVDATGAAYVTGWTDSSEATFPEVGGPDLTYNGNDRYSGDAFVAKVKFDGTALIYAGYIGGSSYDHGRGIAVDATGAAYVTGETNSSEATFPVVGGPDLTYNGGDHNYSGDAFVAKVKPDGTALIYAGYIGGLSEDSGNGITVDATGAAYVTGGTTSSEETFPVVGGPDLTYNGGDAFVAKVNSAGTALIYAGYIGGAGGDGGSGIAVDSTGAAYVTGTTLSSEATFPVVGGPDLTFNDGYLDAFVAQVAPDGTALFYAGYIGGSGDEFGRGIAVDSTGAAYVTGTTLSSEATFPIVGGPDLTFNDGYLDAFVAKIGNCGGVGEIVCDPDKDGIHDGADNCQFTANPDQTDTDGDGMGDHCDDSDNDGIVDVTDNCPLVYTYYRDQADADGDGFGDACDDGDTDGDGRIDRLDNCPSVSNADQADRDWDRSGNACDPDDDDDRVMDTVDNCPLVWNASQIDGDGDGLGDACDLDPLTPTPTPTPTQTPTPTPTPTPMPITCNGMPVTILGTPGNDILMGTSGADVIAGLGGNDTIKGQGGNDVICGGHGNDMLIGGPGNDRLYGERGRDRLYGVQGTDHLDGGPRFDTCHVSRPSDGDTTVRCEKVTGPQRFNRRSFYWDSPLPQ